MQFVATRRLHLQSLGFIHFALHHKKFVNNTLITPGQKRPIYKEIKALLMTLCRAIGDDVTPDAQLFCVSDVYRIIESPSKHDRHLIDKYSEHIRPVVEQITGFATRRQGLMNDAQHAALILRSYAHRRFNETSVDARILTIHDNVAALCSLRYQQTVRTPYQPKWFSQGASEGQNTKIHLDKGLKCTTSNPKPYIHQGVFLIYYNRFAQYKAALDRTTAVYHGWMAFQYARLHAYINILQLRDIDRIIMTAYYFDKLCIEKAQSLAKAYTPQSSM